MTEDDCEDYWWAAADCLFPDIPKLKYNRSAALAKLLGIDYPRMNYWQVLELTPELKNRLMMLRGAHGKTIRKAMEVKREGL